MTQTNGQTVPGPKLDVRLPARVASMGSRVLTIV
jgi:hypothetical protein